MKTNIERRDFLALMGLSGATAAVGCGPHNEEENWKPWVKPIEGMIPYTAKHYKTASREAPDSSLMIRVMDGRALKAEGNPDHPLASGSITARSQSIIQGLYGTSRVKEAHNADGKALSWAKALEAAKAALEQAKGKNVYALTAPTFGAVQEVWSTFVQSAGTGKHVQYQPFTQSDLVLASERVFGRPEVPLFHLDKADYLLSMGAQFLETWGEPVSQARGYADMRMVKDGHRGKHVQVEARRSQSGANADEWLAARPGSETAIVLALLGHIAPSSSHLSEAEKATIAGLPQVSFEEAASASGLKAAVFEHLADELAHAHHAVVLPAETLQLGADVLQHHMAVLLLNKALGAIGPIVDYAHGKSIANVISHQEMVDLVQAMNDGQVDLLIIKDTNPVYALPKSLGFEQALAKVPFVLVLADSKNETSAKANLVLPVHHELEAWGEHHSYNGLVALQQPVMSPRWEMAQAEDLLMNWANAYSEGTFTAASFREFFQSSVMGRLEIADDKAWREMLKQGGQFDLAGDPLVLSITSDFGVDQFANYQANPVAAGCLLMRESSRYGDGTFADRGWMQELADPMTGVTWDSFLEISVDTAKEKGLTYGDVVSVKTVQGSLELPVMLSDTVAKDVFVLETGQGHSGFDELYNRGVNAFDLFSADLNAAGQFSAGPMSASIAAVGRKERLATVHVPGLGDRITTPLSGTAGDQPLMGHGRDRDVYQTMTLGAFLDPDHHDHGHHGVEYPPESKFHNHHNNNFYPDRSEDPVVKGRDERFYTPYKWELNVDLNRCNGCGSCVTACYAENNLPVMGKDEVARGREMGWMRINRYIGFKEDHGDVKTEVAFMPMMCQQCGSAPCEAVCPSLATYHNKEGLNAMVYNRCIGTRYCANNCTYKARRFNWYDATFEGDLNWALNPEVSVRSRGVMEKCTFCIHRIQEARDNAKDEERMIQDGDIMTACQQACPAKAITFGNVTDKQSMISAKVAEKHAYRSLDNHLSTKPGVSYLKRITLGTESHG